MPYLIGQKRTRELLLTGDLIDAAEAERIGLVNRAVERADVLPTALALAREMAASAPLAVRGTKLALAGPLDSSLDEQLRFEAEQQSRNYESADLREGLAAVREKRPPRFEGR
jgi:enoyl-CoA hydratase/carnithine racemase